MTEPEIIIAPGGRQAIHDMLLRRLGPDVRLLHDPDGAPLLAGSDMHISVSHSRNFAALALHPRLRIGVDIEQPRPEQLARVAARFFTEADARAWGDDLLGAWTAKEAVYKAAGTSGLPLGGIDLSIPGRAAVPDGRRFAISTSRTADYTLTWARPLDPIEEEIDALAGATDADGLYRRGSLHMKLGNHGAALSDFNASAALAPDGPAVLAARGLRAILDFHLPLNP